MKYLINLTALILLMLPTLAFSQEAKMDTVLKVGKIGYRVTCRNKSLDQNNLRVKPVGFENTAREMNFFIKGRVASATIDDLNNDGYPDLILFIFTDSNNLYQTIYAFASDHNKGFVPVALPDLMVDGKLNGGYKGHDEFSMMEGTIMRKFPVFKTGDETDKPTGGKRAIQYTLTGNAESGFKFKVMQTYEIK